MALIISGHIPKLSLLSCSSQAKQNKPVTLVSCHPGGGVMGLFLSDRKPLKKFTHFQSRQKSKELDF